MNGRPNFEASREKEDGPDVEDVAMMAAVDKSDGAVERAAFFLREDEVAAVFSNEAEASAGGDIEKSGEETIDTGLISIDEGSGAAIGGRSTSDEATIEPDVTSISEEPASIEELKSIAEKASSSLVDESRKLEDLWRLEPGRLLNDSIINTYFGLISSHSKGAVYVFSTFFYAKLVENGVRHVQRWTAGENIFRHELIYIPVHLPGHWTFVAIDVPHNKIEYYDSMGGEGREVLHGIKRYCMAEWRRIYGTEAEFQMLVKKEIPRQTNGTDCGVFVCMYARCRMEDLRWLSKMGIMRQIMLHEILAGRILYPELPHFQD
jgi:sentrin-specific protease 1